MSLQQCHSTKTPEKGGWGCVGGLGRNEKKNFFSFQGSCCNDFSPFLSIPRSCANPLFPNPILHYSQHAWILFIFTAIVEGLFHPLWLSGPKATDAYWEGIGLPTMCFMTQQTATNCVALNQVDSSVSVCGSIYIKSTIHLRPSLIASGKHHAVVGTVVDLTTLLPLCKLFNLSSIFPISD